MTRLIDSPRIKSSEAEVDGVKPTDDIGRELATFLGFFASLKLTVILLALALFLVFAGTMAQVEKGIWQVVDEYFRTGIAWIELETFFPPHWFPNLPEIPGVFPFPGGWLIGYLMAINLVCAHCLRFQVQARGKKRIAGCLLIALGIAMTWLVIARGQQDDILELSDVQLMITRLLIKGGLLIGWLWVIYKWVSLDRRQTTTGWLLVGCGLALACLVGWLLFGGDKAVLNDSGVRILWQLMKGGLASCVCLAGCSLLFHRRAGIVVIHAGIGLMMLGELLVGLNAVEGRMRIREGETVNFVEEVRSLELAVVDSSPTEKDKVTVIPDTMLRVGEPIEHPSLPFKVQVTEYLGNSSLRRALPGQPNQATAGSGLKWQAQRAPSVSGTDDGVNMASAYVALTNLRTNEPIGTYLLSLHHSSNGATERVMVDGHDLMLTLRLKRTYKPYAITLHDFRFDKYIGTRRARNFSSDVQLVDPSRGVDRAVRIWMNNPLRYRGETFYQSSYATDGVSGREVTILSVVSNSGWMIPYVSCMLVAMGMCAHFCITLLRFLKRRAAEDVRRHSANTLNCATRNEKEVAKPWRACFGRTPWFALLIVVAAGVLLVSAIIAPRVPDGEMKFADFGNLPVAHEGRIKPFDTLARNSLSLISERQTYRDLAGKRQPAVRWLLDVITQSPVATAHKVFRIDNLELLSTLGLDPRSGYRYALDEFSGKLAVFSAQVRSARAQPVKKLGVYERKVLELDNKVRLYELLKASFRATEIRPGHEAEDLQEATAVAMRLGASEPPLAVPGTVESGLDTWRSFTSAWLLAKHMGAEIDPHTNALGRILQSYRAQEVAGFNREVETYQLSLQQQPPDQYRAGLTAFEVVFNRGQPFLWAAIMYVVVFVLGSAGWLVCRRPLHQAAIWLLALTFLVHTVSLIGRIYISGRPPVTNLYSSAVFIGWGCVILSIVLETIYRLGVGTVLAAATGFTTLLIAHFLARSGDTFEVLQAVLDTQFWLATHVTCITLGYSTTFVAGCLGIFYILCGTFTPFLQRVGGDLLRMIYGTICFALFFSFVGTVLGGLWADDSWGRFWGWDPKENGALMIVLWNALILHARWGGVVRDRGLAVLAVGGNICTAWSWFGTNELAVGLHTYGFTEGVLVSLAVFVLSQLLIMALGMIPPSWGWGSKRKLAAANGN